MRKAWSLIWIGSFYICSTSGFAQVQLDLEQFIESHFELQEEDFNYEDLYESLYQYFREPMDLNSATRDEIQSLHLLSQSQLNSFFIHITKNGPLLSIYELQAVPGFDAWTIDKLRPFVYVRDQGVASDPRPFAKRVLQNGYLILRIERPIETKEGYKPDSLLNGATPYSGNPYKLYGRLNISQYQDFSIGVTFENDPGEKITWDPGSGHYGMDFNSFHFMLKNRGALKRLVVGDYQIQLGQGLLLGSGFHIGKGAETVAAVRRSSLGILPYTSLRESGFFRGIAGTINWGKSDFTVFYSRSKLDGSFTIADDTTISAVRASGLHRTFSEIENRANLAVQSWGGNWLFNSEDKRLQLGLTYINTKYEYPLQRAFRKYNQYEFKGSSNSNLGGFYSYNWHNFNFFGEAAYSRSGGYGAVLGMVGNLSKQVEMSLLWRHYDRNFHSTFGNSFSENSRNINESGIYWGLKVSPSKKVSLAAYLDQFKFPWLKFRVDAPSEGWGFQTRLNYHPNRKVDLYLHYRIERKQINVSGNDVVINPLANGTKTHYIFNLNWRNHDKITLRSRVQLSSYELLSKTTYGYLMAQDFNFKTGAVSMSTRFALFDTDDYENRQYLYERNLRYAFSIPAFDGRGLRTYLLVNYKPHPNWTVEGRIARTKYLDRSEVGTGLETTLGNTRTDIKFQLQFRF